jgi:RNA polymerase sigma-70 factor (ECF subfamily)
MWAASRSQEASVGPGFERGTSSAVRLWVLSDDVYPDWETTYRDNVGRLYRLMYSRVGNRADAEDLTAETFRSAIGPLNLSLSKPEVRSYLLKTAGTVLSSYWRVRLGHPVTSIDPERDLEFLADSSGPQPPSDAPARANQILSALPERYRRILELRFLEASSIKEAASAMNISVSNAKVLQHRALRMASHVARELNQ